MKKFIVFIVIVAGLAAGAWFWKIEPAMQRSKQKQTVSDIRNTGTAMMSYLTDQVGAVEPETQFATFEVGSWEPQLIRIEDKRQFHQAVTTLQDVSFTFKTSENEPEKVVTYKKVPFEIAYNTLHPSDKVYYMKEVPKTDAWGHELEFYITENLLSENVMIIRSAGRDGKFSGNTFTMGAFDPSDLDQDIIWMDGYFARWPQGVVNQ